jgi:hypothetical protein
MWLQATKSLQNRCIQAAPLRPEMPQIRLVSAAFVGQIGLSHIPVASIAQEG